MSSAIQSSASDLLASDYYSFILQKWDYDASIFYLRLYRLGKRLGNSTKFNYINFMKPEQ